VLVLATVSPARAQTLFRFPAQDPKGVHFRKDFIIHVDHDPVDKQLDVECVNYKGDGFPWCYDQHKGTDFLLINGFATMDAHDVEVVAAADGVVVEAVDGNYDRCHAEGMSVSCDGHPVVANRVALRHADGLKTSYVHLKKGSIKVAKGQQVSCGDVLGYVGSSGMSATPHLHFEVRDKNGAVLDPYAGPKSQPQSYWTQQQGSFIWPGDRCQGDPIQPDAGTPDAGPPDAALDATIIVSDGATLPGDGDDHLAVRRSGCMMGTGTNSGLPPTLLFLLLFAALRRYRS
jgi:hypothetical protein